MAAAATQPSWRRSSSKTRWTCRPPKASRAIVRGWRRRTASRAWCVHAARSVDGAPVPPRRSDAAEPTATCRTCSCRTVSTAVFQLTSSIGQRSAFDDACRCRPSTRRGATTTPFGWSTTRCRRLPRRRGDARRRCNRAAPRAAESGRRQLVDAPAASAHPQASRYAFCRWLATMPSRYREANPEASVSLEPAMCDSTSHMICTSQIRRRSAAGSARSARRRSGAAPFGAIHSRFSGLAKQMLRTQARRRPQQ